MNKAGPQTPFSIDEETGIIIAGVVDRELQAEHEFQVRACDQGAPRPLCSTVNVVIGITDTNDNAPGFAQKLQNGELPIQVPADVTGYLTRFSDIL